MSLESLQKDFPRWNITQTPGGAWVARRKRHMVLTNARIDQGLRDCLIEEDEASLRQKLLRQNEIDKALESESGSKK